MLGDSPSLWVYMNALNLQSNVEADDFSYGHTCRCAGTGCGCSGGGGHGGMTDAGELSC